MKSRILAVGIDRLLYDKIEPLLNRSYFDVDRVPRGESALILCSQVRFDLMIVGYPLPDMSLDALLEGIRRPESPCAENQLLLLAPAEQLAELHPLVGDGVDAVMSIGQPVQLLEEVASRLLEVAPRTATRLMVKLEAELREGKSLTLCQTENVSETGMLLRTDRLYPVGTQVQFELFLPGDRAAISGRAEVVRHTHQLIERVEGLGVRFAEFAGEGRRRLQEFLVQARPKAS